MKLLINIRKKRLEMYQAQEMGILSCKKRKNHLTLSSINLHHSLDNRWDPLTQKLQVSDLYCHRCGIAQILYHC
jgi:hypothetical protein